MLNYEQDRRARLVAIIGEIAQTDAGKIQGEERLREDLGLDSLGSLELLSSISEELKIHLEVEDAMDLRTVDDACAFVERHYQKQRPDVRVATA